MTKGVKSFLRIAAFLLILALLLSGVNRILEPKYYFSNSKWPTTATYHAFYALERNSVDVLFLGSSHCVNAFCSPEIYSRYGIRSFNLGSEQQSVFLSYFWLKEALRYQSPSVVVLEGRFLRDYHPEFPMNTTEALTRKCLDPMRMSPVKIEAIEALCAVDPSQDKASWYLTNIRFHDRWKELNEADFETGDNAVSHLLGWAPGLDAPPKEYVPVTDDPKAEPAEFLPLMAEYFRKIAKLCSLRGIRLVVVNVPSNDSSSSLFRAYENLCRENGADYLELSRDTEYAQLGIDLSVENPVRHGNLRGNIKISDYIGRILSEDYGVPGVKDSRFEAKLPWFEHLKTVSLLPEVTDLTEYLALLKDPMLDIFISVKDEASRNLTESAREGLKALGLRQDWESPSAYGSSYIGIITDEGILEEAGGPLRVSGRFRNRNSSYTLQSRSFVDPGGRYSSIVIDGRERSLNSRGLNFVVYDRLKRGVVDRVTFDTYRDSSAKR